MTVTGPVHDDQLGKVLVHEHVQAVFAGQELDPSPRPPREHFVARAVERMLQLREFGVNTFVDPCPIDLGRDVTIQKEVAERSGMNIVCATGFYMEADGIGIPYYWRQRWPEEIAELYLHEINHGVGDTGVRPGLIKIATGNPVGRHERKVLHGAALAAAECSLPVLSHTQNAVGGHEQQDILERHGVDLRRTLIGHQDPQDDIGALVAIAERGSYIGIDRVGLSREATDEHRVELVAGLVEAGFGDRVCLSQDHSCYEPSPRPAFWIPPQRAEELAKEVIPNIMWELTDRPHTYLFTDFLPRLRARGIDDATIDAMVSTNPTRFLSGL